MLISLATYGFVGDSYMRFGILHLLGVSVLLVLPYLARQRGKACWLEQASLWWAPS